MELAITENDGVKVVSITGQLDTNSVSEFRERILEQGEGEKGIILDCSQLAYLDSSGLAMLVNLHKTFQANEAKFAVNELPEGVLRVVQFTKLDRVFLLTSSLDEARRSINP